MPQWLTRVSRPPREQIAPTCASVLQAIYMRKWMNERLKRRKKTGDGSPKEASKAPAQEPLQPRFLIMSRLRRPLCQALRQSRFLPTSGTRLQSLRRSIRSRGAGLDRSQSQRLSRRLSPLRRPRRHPPGQWNRDRECRAVVGVAAVAEIVRERQVRPLSQLSPERYPQPNRLLQNRPS